VVRRIASVLPMELICGICYTGTIHRLINAAMQQVHDSHE
jgi:hypothetical protein